MELPKIISIVSKELDMKKYRNRYLRMCVITNRKTKTRKILFSICIFFFIQVNIGINFTKSNHPESTRENIN